jgi:beta-galactosidase
LQEMKRFIIFIGAVLVLLFATGEAVAREVYNIGSGWTFFTADQPSTDGAALVNLPHSQPSTGIANYLKTIDIPSAWEGRRVFLRIGGAGRVTDIFVDGAHSATHRGGNSSFTVEITDRVKWGSPAAVRIVTGSAPSFDVMPTAGGEKIYGGIFRDVELIVCDYLAISPAASIDAPSTEGDKTCEGGDGVWITTDRLTEDRAQGRVRLSLLTPQQIPAGSYARVRFSDGEGHLVAQNSVPVTTSEMEIPFTLSEPHLWQGVDDPYLYDLEVSLRTPENIATDSLIVQTGFRTVGIDKDNNFTLNGKPLKIHGVILPRDRSVVGMALTPFQIEEDVDFILEMGANAVRVTGGQHSDYFYQLCDEAGLVVWNDGPFTGAAYPTDIDFVDTRAFRQNGLRQMTEMVSELYNHPSVAIWGISSNISSRGEAPKRYIENLNRVVHSLDAGRLTASSSVSDGDVNKITDMVSFDLSLGWQSGLPDAVVPWLEQLRTGWPELRAGISYSAGASILHQSELLERPTPESDFHPEGWQTFFHEEYLRHAVDAEGLWGVFVGNMFDSGAAKLSGSVTASADGGIDDRGLVTFDRKDRKDAFWLYRAAWNRTTPFVHIAGTRLQGRTQRTQTIRVYSNLPEVELFAAGRSLGVRTGDRGVFVWEDVAMRTGANRVEARARGTLSPSQESTATDRATFTVYPSAATAPAPMDPRRTANPQQTILP